MELLLILLTSAGALLLVISPSGVELLLILLTSSSALLLVISPSGVALLLILLTSGGALLLVISPSGVDLLLLATWIGNVDVSWLRYWIIDKRLTLFCFGSRILLSVFNDSATVFIFLTILLRSLSLQNDLSSSKFK